MDRRPDLRDDQGETLVELLVSIVILGIGAVAILAGLMFSVKSAEIGRSQATGGAYVRSWAEAIQADVDAANSLGNCSTYGSIFTSLKSGNPDLAGYTQSCVATSEGDGLQRLTLRLTSAGDAQHAASESLVVLIRQPCNGATSSSADDPCS